MIPTYGDPLGTAWIEGCEGEGGFRIEAVAIVGVSPEVAFASPQYEESVFLPVGTASFPPELKHLRHEPRCAEKDTPISLHGHWLGILGPHGENETDLIAPYVLEMRVDEASAARYERAFLTIHVPADLGRPLSEEDFRSSLREGGVLSVTATCLDGGFSAEQVTASPAA